MPEIKSYDSHSPTERLYGDALHTAFRMFNDSLFGGELPDLLITVVRKANSRGYYNPAGFDAKSESGKLAELGMNPVHFVRDDKATLSTVAHEMCHHWQHSYGNPGTGRYHNAEWADKMESIGLMPSSTGEPGGKRTGARVTHYIVPGGPFDLAADAVLAAGFKIDWAAKDAGGDPKKGRVRHTCPDCGRNVWSKPGDDGFVVACVPCQKIMRAEGQDGDLPEIMMVFQSDKPVSSDGPSEWFLTHAHTIKFAPGNWLAAVSDDERKRLVEVAAEFFRTYRLREVPPEDMALRLEQVSASEAALSSGAEWLYRYQPD